MRGLDVDRAPAVGSKSEGGESEAIGHYQEWWHGGWGSVKGGSDWSNSSGHSLEVDSTPPEVQQLRLVDGEVWVELSEEVLLEPVSRAVESGAISLQHQGQPLPLLVTQPVVSGPEAGKRLVFRIDIDDPAELPEAGANLSFALPAHTLFDTFQHQAATGLSQVIPWGPDVVVLDTANPRVDRVCVAADGTLEIIFSEPPSLPSLLAQATLDSQPVEWQLDADSYTVRSAEPLGPGSHTLQLGTAVVDLDNKGLPEAVTHTFATSTGSGLSVFERPSDRFVAASTIGNHFGFHGLGRDEETGFYYARNRYYDPEMGRFVTADPMGYVDGPSLYQYGLNSPMNAGDPLGMCVGRTLKASRLCRWLNAAAVDLVEEGDSPSPAEGEVRERFLAARRNAVVIQNGVATSPRIENRISTNLHQGPMDQVNGLIVHQTGAPTAQSTLNHYQTSDVGAHFLIDRSGQIFQTARLDQSAAHVGKLKSRCLADATACTNATSMSPLPVDLAVGAENRLREAAAAAAQSQEATSRTALHRHESSKEYPLRYPSNDDSIGIELVGVATDPSNGRGPYWGPDAVYDDATDAQNEALSWLVRQLQRTQSVGEGNVFRHPEVSYKNPTEAQTADWEVTP